MIRWRLILAAIFAVVAGAAAWASAADGKAGWTVASAALAGSARPGSADSWPRG